MPANRKEAPRGGQPGLRAALGRVDVDHQRSGSYESVTALTVSPLLPRLSTAVVSHRHRTNEADWTLAVASS